MLLIARGCVASDMPRARARAREAATYQANPALLPCTSALRLHIISPAMAAASVGREDRRDRGGLVHSLLARHRGINMVWRS